MNLTEERAAKILAYLNENEESTAKLAGKTFEEIAEKMTADGCEITAKELEEMLKSGNASEELDEDALENVAGGCGDCLRDVIYTIRRIFWGR